MRNRRLGRTALKVSELCLGTMNFGPNTTEADSFELLDHALDNDIDFVDTADQYGGSLGVGATETIIGNWLGQGGGRRERIVLATKLYEPMSDRPNDRGLSARHIRLACDASLRRLQTDHIDLYYVHRWDETTPIEETLRGLDDLVRMGKVRYVGASDFAAWQLAKANLLADVRGWSPFAVIQSHYHMLERQVEQEVLPYCQAHGVGFVPYFPLAGGFLTGKYKRGEAAPTGSRGASSSYVQEYMTAANYDTVDKLTAWAAARERGLNELAQAWLMAQPQVCSVISGATKLAHVESNVKAADWELTSDELAEIGAILDSKETVNS